MKKVVYFLTLYCIAITAEARGGSFIRAPDWQIKSLSIAFAMFFLFFLITKPIQSIKYALSIAAAMFFLFSIDYLQKNYGSIVVVVVGFIMWVGIMKFVDLISKDR
jgi:hypothetical protein